jgi:DNA-binding NtrC family response regulator/predicted ATPase
MAMNRPRLIPLVHASDRMVGNSPAIAALRAQIRHLAAFDAVGNPHVPTVLLQGETGTGKGLVARIIHESGPRAHGPFLEVNCAAIPETLLEAEVFGFAAGAFTDAKRAKPGLLEAASRGTLVLDEIDALPLPLQSKLLTAVEEKRVRRLGAVAAHMVDIKLIAATQTDLTRLAADGRFRSDLYHRLAVVLLEVPPLRMRGEDVVVLAQHFLRRYAEAHRLSPKRLVPAAAEWLQRYPWPGNVRELSHLMERATLLCQEAMIDPDTLERLCLPPLAARAETATAKDDAASGNEAAQIRHALLQTRGNVVRAARLLGLSRKALRHRMARYGIARPSETELAMPPADFATNLTSRPAHSPSKGKGRPLVPSPGWGERKGEGASGYRYDRRPASASAEAPTQAHGWEQKPVAVLAIEVTWPTATDHEALHYEPWTVTAHWEQAIVEKLQGFGGVVLQRSPSLLTVTFGVPQTQEQLPQRAVQAALALRQLVAEAPKREPHPELRLAVHWGQLRIDVQARDPTERVLAIGETLALPVRLLGQAASGEVLVSPEVGPLVEGWFELQARRVPQGDGKPGEIVAYTVMGVRPWLSPLAMHGQRPLSPFVGRKRELATLQELLGQVKEGRGQVVGIVGEPGVGKSRLLYEFHQLLTEQPVTYLEGHCLSYGSVIPYLPVLDLLRSRCGITPIDSAEVTTEKVRVGLETVEMDPEEKAPYLLQLLGITVGADRLAGLSPEMIRARTFEVLQQMSLHDGQRQPLVLAVENLQWIDQTSEAFLASLIERLAGAPILLLLTYRPGYRSPWMEKSYVSQIVLQPLAPQESRRMLRAILQTESLPDPMAQAILAKAQGNPFFLEEIVQVLVEQEVLLGTGPLGATGQSHLLTKSLAEIQIPPMVQGVLAARIDRLPPAEKALLQTLAVIGHAFSLNLLTRVVAKPEAELRQQLSHLQAAEFLYEQPTWPELQYTFKHVLTQDVAYTSMPREQRQVLHECTAQAIEALFEHRLGEHYSELAHHYRHSENTEKAVVYLYLAGHQAVQRSAYSEAISLLTTGLELLTTLLDTPERARQELDLLLLLGPALMAIKGHAAPEVEQVYARARVLCEHAGDIAALFRVLQGLRTIANQRGEFEMDRELGKQLLSLAQHLQDPALLLAAHRALGSALFSLGELTLARRHFEQGIALYGHQPQGSLAVLYGQDPGVGCLRYLARILWLLGYPDQALQRIHEALTLARTLAHPQSLAEALCHMAHIHRLRREVPQTQQWAEAAMAHAQEQGFPVWLSIGVILQGWALVMQSRGAQGMAQMHEVLASVQATRRVQGQPSLLAWLAEGYLELGQAEEGLSMIAEALAVVHTAGERFYEAELHRLRGELLLIQAASGVGSGSAPAGTSRLVKADVGAINRSPSLAQAEACFQQALDMASRQQAKSLELRAATSLSRLWQQQGKRNEARELLAPIYGWFTEGFDTTDLQEAKALLGELR